MNLKKLIAFFVVSLFFIPLNFVCAEDLEIEDGKNLLFNFRGNNTWYDDTQVYDNINIGAGTKVVLESEWQYVFLSSNTVIEQTEEHEEGYEGPETQTQTTTYNYRQDETIATLAIDASGKIILNAGSELSIRNQYSLITSTQDASLEYEEIKVNHESKIVLKDAHLSNTDYVLDYESIKKDTAPDYYTNRKIKEEDLRLFTGDIIFESGDSDTTLTFQEVADKESEFYVLPSPSDDREEGDIVYRDEMKDMSAGIPSNKTNIVNMNNNFQINSNRAVFNVVGADDRKEGEQWTSSSRQVILGNLGKTPTLSGDGTIVKKGEGMLNLFYFEDEQGHFLGGVIGNDLTGTNTGYAWRIEEGLLVASKNDNLGTAGIYIDSKGTLGLGISNINEILSPATIIDDIKSGLTTNVFSNKITSSGGEISIGSGSQVELSGKIDTVGTGNNLRLTFYEESALVLSGQNDAQNFIINFGGTEGGESNYLISDVEGLALNSISVTNITDEDLKDFAFFELVLKEDEDKEYSGSLEGDMYLHKLGSGLVTLSGNNTYTEGTYISEGGLLLSNSNAIGTGNIWFDAGERGNPDTYASVGVSSMTTGDIELSNNIHVKNGAILNVAEKQNLRILGDIVSYDARPGYETEFIKTGLGEATISGTLEADRQINISTFTVQDGGFVLDKNIVLNSYFSLDGQGAYLKINEKAGVKNNIVDIHSGDLIIFNENCISSATAINFYNTETSTEVFSKFHTMSTTTISNETISGTINIAKNIEFVTDGTTTAKLDKFTFESGNNKVIVKSGEGTFVADNNNSGTFGVSDLYVNAGKFKIENTNMEVSGTTLIDGGILLVSGENSHFASTAAEKKIVVLNGGIGIYDDNSIASDTELRFEGTDTENLSRLVVEAADVNLTNSIYVKTGVIIENERDLTFSGEHITGEYGILAKDGVGTMIIDSAGTFQMGELRSLGGNLLVKSDIEISTVSILGEKALISFENVNNANIKEHLFMGSGGTLSLLESKANISNLDLDSANIIVDSNSELNSNTINFDSSTVNLKENSSVIKATTINLVNGSTVEGFGNLNATVNVRDGSSIYVGSDGETYEKLKMKNVVFESGSNLYIDVNGENETSDLLEVTGDITVQKNVKLYVNFINENTGDGAVSLAGENSDAPKKFKFLSFTGSSSFDNTTNEIFDIILSNPRYSASTFLLGKDIFLQLAQEWFVYDIPGVTKNQKEMIDVFNKIYADDIAKENMKSVLSTLDAIYQDYRSTGNRTQFLNALQDLSGIFYSNAFMTSAMLSKAKIIYNRVNDYSKEREENHNVWAQVYTNSFSVAENEENPKFENGMYGMIAGYDTMVEENVLFGIAGFYGQGELKQLKDKADVIDAGVNVYGDYKVNENIDVKGLIGYSMQDYDTTRNLRFINQEIKSKFATNTINIDLEAAYRYDLNEKLSLKPLVGANCAIVSNGDIEEDGDSEQRLKIGKDSYTRAEVRVGVGLQSKAVSPFNWYVAAAVKQIVVGDKFTTKSSFINAPDYEFEIESTKLASTSFVGNLGCAYDINSSFNVSLDLNADTGSASGFGANIGATYRW